MIKILLWYKLIFNIYSNKFVFITSRKVYSFKDESFVLKGQKSPPQPYRIQRQ